MPARRFFVEGVRKAGEVVEIGGDDAHKIVHVLRLRMGSRVDVIDSSGREYPATIELDGAHVSAALGEPAADDAAADVLRIDLAQAVPKGQKMDFVVEKATELGASAVLPFYAQRSVARSAGAAKLERWRRIARSAAVQCGRRDTPGVCEPVAFDALAARFSEYDAVLLAWELAPRARLRERLPALLEGVRRVLIVIGPEGGFSHREAEAARDRGAELLWLGRRILRTETAGLALLAVIEAFAS